MFHSKVIIFSLLFCLSFQNKSLAQLDNGQNHPKKDSLYQIIFDKDKSVSITTDAIKALNTFRIPMEDTIFQQIDKLILSKNCTPKDRVNLFHYYGIGYYRKGDYQNAERQLEQSYNSFKTYNQLDVDLAFFTNYGLVKNNLGKNNEAIPIYLEGIQIAEKARKNKDLGHLYTKLGDIYVNLKKYNDADNYYRQAVALGKKIKDQKVEAYALRGLGTSALNAGDYNKAVEIFKEAISIFESLQDGFMINDVKSFLAATYDEMGRYDAAEKLYDEAALYFKNSGYKGDLYYIAIDKGKHLIKKGDFKNAIKSCSYAKDNLLEIGDIFWATEAWKCMYEAAKKDRNYKDALTYYEGFIKYHDSLVNDKNIQKITELRKDFEFDKEKEKISIETTQKIEREKIFQKYMGLGLLLLSGLLFFAFRAYKTKQKANASILQKNIELEKYSQANENLIFSLSHDIKEPMLGVQLLLKKLKSEDEHIQKASESMGNQIASINSIVNNLLQLKKSSNTTQEGNVSHEMIVHTIDNIAKELNYKLVEKNIKLHNTVYHTPLLTLPISSQKLYLTLLNLINNAIKHSPYDSTIEIFAKSDGIYIRDFGSGIDPDTMAKIGKDNIDKDDYSGGSGMGLMLVSNLLAGTGVRLYFENLQGGTLAGIKLHS